MPRRRVVGSSAGRLVLWQAWDLHDRPDLDRAPAHPRDAGGNVDRLVEIGGVDQIVATELLTRLRKRAIGYQPFAITHPNAGRRRCQVEWGGAEIMPTRVELSGEPRGLAVALLPLVRVQHLLITVNQQHVFHLDVSHLIKFTRR